MAPANNTKANYKTFEAQARMVRAIVAAHPEVKWNYKEIVACYGSDMTEHALNHRFRRLKAQTVIIREARSQKLDTKYMTCNENELPITQDKVQLDNIAMYFGQSTADGIQFQFRSIKKDAETLRKIVKDGGSVAESFDMCGTPGSTPAPTPGSRRRVATGTNTKKGRKPVGRKLDTDDEANDDSSDQETPSKKTKMEHKQVVLSDVPRMQTLPIARPVARTTQSQVNASFTDRAANAVTSNAAPSMMATPSIFGAVPSRPTYHDVQPGSFELKVEPVHDAGPRNIYTATTTNNNLAYHPDEGDDFSGEI